MEFQRTVVLCYLNKRKIKELQWFTVLGVILKDQTLATVFIIMITTFPNMGKRVEDMMCSAQYIF